MKCLLYMRFRLHGENFYEGVQRFRLDKHPEIIVECSIFFEPMGTMIEIVLWGDGELASGFDVLEYISEEYLSGG